ncbi:MAG: sigma-54 dependent transcriptional regulator [Acidobacteriota bacterium]|nr:sigma-54 dependent transcriptional regulator [Blastocatellia bacterium]MDW8411937.1 sigma-54 dependent transcriptional regulator [Acidobacteriota bacterium]
MDILIVEDKDSLRQVLRLTLEHAGYQALEARDLAEAVKVLDSRAIQLVLTDLRLPRGSGLDVLKYSKEVCPEAPVIVMTAYGSVDEAVQAMKEGAYDFLQKPVDTRHLLLLMERAIESMRLRTENLLLKEEFSRRYGFPRIIGESEGIKKASKAIQQVADTDATVLLLGESGCGKELFARAVHYLSKRREGPFVAINCAAIPESLIENELFGHERGAYTGADSRAIGKFELAQNGTLFLDEIAELPPNLQTKLLRVLQERRITRVGGRSDIPVNVRIVAATNQDLGKAMSEKRFREDLYFRLAVFPVVIPPLRARREDIEPLALEFLRRYAREIRKTDLSFDEEALAALKSYDWPGNVRELENCIERAVILCDGKKVTSVDLQLEQTRKVEPSEFDYSGSLDEVSERALNLVQKKKIEMALRESGFNKAKAAESLRISYKTLLSKMKELKIDLP